MTTAKLTGYLLLLLTCGTAFGSPKHAKPHIDYSQQKVAFQIGETTVHAQVREFGHGHLTMVNLHDDENSSVEAGAAVLEQLGGRLIELTHSGKRRVVFTLDEKEYSFDPNRIFSHDGVRKTVKGEGTVPEEAFRDVERFGHEFLEYFKLHKAKTIITLHNNGEGGLSIHTYEPGGDWAADTDELFVSPVADPDDFCFTTNRRSYEYLKHAQLNVILQDNRIKRDDGSLSVFAGRHSIRYINVEAEPIRQEEQIRMLKLAVESFKQ